MDFSNSEESTIIRDNIKKLLGNYSSNDYLLKYDEYKLDLELFKELKQGGYLFDLESKNPFNLEFKPFDNYGKPIKGMSWHKISYEKEKGQGSYILKMDPGAKSIAHEHVDFEEFYMLDGELTDADGKIFKKGDFISFEPG